MTKTVSIVTALALGYGLLAAPANAAESAYTDVNLDACTTIAEEPEQESFVSLKCPGYGSYPFYFKEGDLRQADRMAARQRRQTFRHDPALFHREREPGHRRTRQGA